MAVINTFTKKTAVQQASIQHRNACPFLCNSLFMAQNATVAVLHTCILPEALKWHILTQQHG
jgi:hypothetical protein